MAESEGRKIEAGHRSVTIRESNSIRRRNSIRDEVVQSERTKSRVYSDASPFLSVSLSFRQDATVYRVSRFIKPVNRETSISFRASILSRPWTAFFSPGNSFFYSFSTAFPEISRDSPPVTAASMRPRRAKLIFQSGYSQKRFHLRKTNEAFRGIDGECNGISRVSQETALSINGE